mgnify:CR=1 FL=1
MIREWKYYNQSVFKVKRKNKKSLIYIKIYKTNSRNINKKLFKILMK